MELEDRKGRTLGIGHPAGFRVEQPLKWLLRSVDDGPSWPTPAGAGVGPLLTVWDRTKGRQNVKAVASLGNFPYYLLSSNAANAGDSVNDTTSEISEAAAMVTANWR